MKRVGMVLIAAALLAPAAAEAQRPSNNMHTRSADVYLKQAAETRVTADRLELFEKALQSALAGVEQDANNPRSWFQAGQAYAGMQDWVGADSAFARAERMHAEYAAEINPIRLNAWISAYNAGVQALQAGDYKAAIASLETADRLYSKRPEALVTLGSLYAEEGEHAKAEQAYRKVLGILRGPERAKQNEKDRQNWAEDELSVSLRLANLLNEQNRAEDAEKVLREIVAAHPQNHMARANLAGLLSRAGKDAEAAAMYRELLQVQDLGETTLFNIGVGLFRAEQFTESAEAFRRALAVNPQSHEALYNLAQAKLALTGRLEDERGTAAAPRKEQIRTELAQLSEQMLETTERLHQLDPTNRNVLMMMAQAQRTIGETKQGASADEWNKKVLATLEKHGSLAFEVGDVVARTEGNDFVISGRLTSLKDPTAAAVRIRFHVLAVDGSMLATEEIQVEPAAKDESRRLNVRLSPTAGDKVPAGWSYQIVQ